MWKTNFAGFLFAFAVALPVHADQGAASPQYPSKLISLIVPYASGGATDKIARLVAEHFSTGLKQPVIVENRPGANNILGANALLACKADGYTLMLASNVVARLGQALAALYHDPEFRKTLHTSGEEPLLGTPDQMQTRINQEIALWKNIVAEAEIEPMD